MIDTLIIKPLNKSIEWLKNHPAMFLLLFALLVALPPFLYLLITAINKMVELLKGFLGIKAAQAVYDVSSKIINWVFEKPNRRYIVALIVAVVLPFVGLPIALWLFLDSFKKGTYTAELNFESQPNTPERKANSIQNSKPEPAEAGPEIPDFDDTEMFGGI